MRNVLIPVLLIALLFTLSGCVDDGELRIRNRTAAKLYLSVDNAPAESLVAWSNWSKFYSVDRSVVISYNGDYVFDNSITRDVRSGLVSTVDIQPDAGAIHLTNDQNITISEMYISPTGNPDWGDDELTGELNLGQSTLWTATAGNWDIRIVDTNHITHYLYNQVVTLNQTLELLVSDFITKSSQE